MKHESPFMVIQDCISPLLCDELIDTMNFTVPDVNTNNIPQKTIKHSELCEEILYDYVITQIPELESHYKISYEGTEKMICEWYPKECKGEVAHAENSEYLRGKWLRVRPRDFTGIFFLSTYVDSGSLDPFNEVYGGKLEFPQHDFSFQPEAGTFVIFPSVPHFINSTTPIVMGNLYQIRVHIKATVPYLYNPENFPGDYRSWLEEFA